jgi:hypothetical protein
VGIKGKSTAVAAVRMDMLGPGALETVRRPKPPGELNDEQAVEWHAVVDSMAAEHFATPESHGMLVQYCRLRTRARRLAQLIDQMEKLPKAKFKAKAYQSLVRSEEQVSRSIAAIAARMRISQQSLTSPIQIRGKKQVSPKPPAREETPWLSAAE